MSIDFQGIRQAAPIAETIGRYLELKRQGGEYKARCPFHNDGNPSFHVVPRKDKAFCMSCGWHGDVIDFVAEIESVDTVEAARRLSGGELPDDRPPLPELPPDESDEWRALLPAPEYATAYDPAQTYNPRRGRVVNWRRNLTRCDAYRAADGRILGYVVRMEIEGQKITPTVVWAVHRDGREGWTALKFPSPRPLQGLDALAARPEARVLIVSGEKCREVAAATFRSFVAVTWPGGDQNVGRADWSPLHGRQVSIWPDADESGIAAADGIAALLHGHAAQVRVIDPSGQPEGWDIADAVAEGLSAQAIAEWIGPRIREWTPPAERGDPEPTPAVNGHPVEPRRTRRNGSSEPLEGDLITAPQKPADAAYSTTQSWTSLGLELSSNGTPLVNIDNAAAVLEGHDALRGRFYYDDFLKRLMTTWGPDDAPREWTDGDDVLLTRWMQRTLKLGKIAPATVRDAVTAVALGNRRNEAIDWLNGLPWDGVPRLADLLPTAFQTVRTPYTEAVGRCWLVSMVARVLDPGCKVDTMPVFEGGQGIKKSTAMQALVGARWFAEASESPTSKDFYQVLQGKLLIEIAEMDTFSRAEVHTIKRVITCRVDRYRAPYGRRAEDYPRMSVFAGTTNKDDWNRDETGARRFWPVACAGVDIAWIERHRTQLFAEAVARYDRGEPWWDVPDAAARDEQEARRSSDEWEPVIERWLLGRDEVTVGDVLEGALKLPPDKWDKASQMRAATALRVLGWVRTTARRGGRLVKVWQEAVTGGNGGNKIPL